MGIPKFFKFLAERYPCIISPFIDATLPSIDNLYLDMNGIIHNCSHSNDKSKFYRLTEKEMMLSIFHYIDRLFDLIKPRKYFFMAVDGVAPRAKMNQQRSRRFRSAQESYAAREEAKKRGEQLPDDLFDSNAISPGTEFMAKLSSHLNYFIRKKMSEDIRWQKCKVILSGHEVPGEGEHKIMSFIRRRKMTEKNYSPNETHCLYGLDADLIMLGLMTHEPHFMLLREDVFGQFARKPPVKGKSNQKESVQVEPPNPLQQPFQLLHLGVLREYMQLEFDTLLKAKNSKLKFDLERVIDDFVLMCFLVGNDFLPHSPTLDIREGAIGILYEVYQEILPNLADYLTENGRVNYTHFEVFCAVVGKREKEMLRQKLEQMLVKGGGRGKNKRHTRKKHVTQIIEENITDARGKPAVAVKMTDAQSFEQHLLAHGLLDENAPSQSYATEDITSAVAPQRTQVISGSAADRVLEEFDHPQSEHELKQAIAQQDKLLNQERGSLSKQDAAFATVATLEDCETEVLVDPNAPIIDEEGTPEDDDEEEEEETDQRDILMTSYTHGSFDFTFWYKLYYKRKLGIDFDNDPKAEQKKQEVIKHYVEGIEWIYRYYYNGVASWKWFYPYHYSPICLDLKNLKEIANSINFDLGRPFLPYEQLLGVLPPKSSHLLPQPYRKLFLEKNSPILDFYPEDFAIDREGTRYEYEGTVILPFIDENRLRDAMALVDTNQLSAEEKKRNSFGTEYIFQYADHRDKAFKPYSFHSTMPGEMPDVLNCRAIVHDFAGSQQDDQTFKFIPRLCKGVKLGPHAPEGFPSLFTKHIKGSIEELGISIFGIPSKKPSMIIRLKEEEHVTDQEEQEFDQNIKDREAAGDAAAALGSVTATNPDFDAIHDVVEKERQEEKSTEVPEEETPLHRNVKHPNAPPAAEGKVRTNQKPKEDPVTVEDVKDLLGQRIWIGYPFPRLAIVESCSDQFNSMYSETDRTGKGVKTWVEAHGPDDQESFVKEAKHHETTLLKRYGLKTNRVDVLLYVKLFNGMKKTRDGKIVRSFTDEEFAFPYQLMVDHYDPIADDKFKTRLVAPLHVQYPMKSRCIVMSDMHEYIGEKVVVLGYSDDGTKLKVGIERDPVAQPPRAGAPAPAQAQATDGETSPLSATSSVASFEDGKPAVGGQQFVPPSITEINSLILPEIVSYSSQKYFALSVVAKMVQMSTLNLGLIIGKWRVDDPKGRPHNLGLNLRDTKHNTHIIGYAKHDTSNQTLDETYFLNFNKHTTASSISKFSIEGTYGWELSEKAVDLIQRYKAAYPEVFKMLEDNGSERFSIVQLYGTPDQAKVKLEEIKQWIESQEHSKLPMLSAQDNTLPTVLIQSLETKFIEFQNKATRRDMKPFFVDPACVYRPPEPFPRHLPYFRRDRYDLGHQVVNLSGSGLVPFGMCGVIIGIQGSSANIVFPTEFIGGNTLNGCLKTYRGQTLPLEQLLNLTALQQDKKGPLRGLVRVTAQPQQVVAMAATPVVSNDKKLAVKTKKHFAQGQQESDLRESYSAHYYTVQQYSDTKRTGTPTSPTMPLPPVPQVDYSSEYRKPQNAQEKFKDKVEGKKKGFVPVKNAFETLDNKPAAANAKKQVQPQAQQQVDQPGEQQQQASGFDPSAFFANAAMQHKQDRVKKHEKPKSQQQAAPAQAAPKPQPQHAPQQQQQAPVVAVAQPVQAQQVQYQQQPGQSQMHVPQQMYYPQQPYPQPPMVPPTYFYPPGVPVPAPGYYAPPQAAPVIFNPYAAPYHPAAFANTGAVLQQALGAQPEGEAAGAEEQQQPQQARPKHQKQHQHKGPKQQAPHQHHPGGQKDRHANHPRPANKQ